jgi:hypothetical protein
MTASFPNRSSCFNADLEKDTIVRLRWFGDNESGTNSPLKKPGTQEIEPESANEKEENIPAVLQAAPLSTPQRKPPSELQGEEEERDQSKGPFQFKSGESLKRETEGPSLPINNHFSKEEPTPGPSFSSLDDIPETALTTRS